METILSVILVFMILGAIYALHARDLLSALISCGIVGYGLVICFLLLKAPDLAIVQIVVETITVIIMVSVVLASTRDEIEDPGVPSGRPVFSLKMIVNIIVPALVIIVMIYSFRLAISELDPFGEHILRMSRAYLEGAADKT
ncbi:MAG: DUF4040 domain-containing protein, partial [Bacteroidales bacterium]